MSISASIVGLTLEVAAPTGLRTFRQVAPKLQLYCGVAVLLFAAIFVLTGSILAIEREIEGWLTCNLTRVSPGPQHLSLSYSARET